MFGSGSRISLDSDLLKRCRDHAKIAGYSSVEEFIQHALETALRKTASGSEDDPRVLERLKGLGYIE